MLLLFARGQRPDIAVLREVGAGTDRLAVTNDLGDPSDFAGVELLRDGMTYDLVGAAPGRPVGAPHLVHRLGVPRDLDESQTEALALQPGPHLAQAAGTVPVVRTMMGVAAMIVPHLPGLVAVAWRPAGTLIGPDYFVSSMTAWLAGGAFPALGLTAFAPGPDGSLRSEGLSFFTGQELLLGCELAEDRGAGPRLGICLVNHLIGQGRLKTREAIVCPDGEQLILEPSADMQTIRVHRG